MSLIQEEISDLDYGTWTPVAQYGYQGKHYSVIKRPLPTFSKMLYECYFLCELETGFGDRIAGWTETTYRLPNNLTPGMFMDDVVLNALEKDTPI